MVHHPPHRAEPPPRGADQRPAGRALPPRARPVRTSPPRRHRSGTGSRRRACAPHRGRLSRAGKLASTVLRGAAAATRRPYSTTSRSCNARSSPPTIATTSTTSKPDWKPSKTCTTSQPDPSTGATPEPTSKRPSHASPPTNPPPARSRSAYRTPCSQHDAGIASTG